jgi:pilus assembly protein CpaC
MIKSFNITSGKTRRSTALLSLVLMASVSVTTIPGLPVVGESIAADNKIRKISSKTQNVKLGLNKSIVIDLPQDASDILVANPGVADAITRTARRIYIFGKQVGSTNVFVFGANGEQVASIELTIERDVAGLDAYLARFIEDSDIKAEIINDNVVLTGTVQTPQDSARAVQLAEIFVTGGEATTGTFNSSSVSSSSATTSVVVGSTEDTRSSKIVNLLKISGDDQVTLKVTVAEISRSVMKQLGVNLLAKNSGNGINFSTDTYTGLGKVLQNPLPATITGALGATSLSATINAMEQSGVMKTLAEPTLTAVSGEKATFKAGGEYNILSKADYTTDDAGKGTYSYTHSKVEYGIGLEFQPTVLSPGRISLKVRTSVSEPTTEGSIQNAGANIISIRKRLADTTIELPSGGSMMIAGLVRDDVRQVINGTPGLRNLPVLGALFRSRDFVRNESELVIIVTPYLVRPVARNKLAKPDDNFEVPSDGAANLLGRLNRVYGTMQTNLPQGRYNGVVGFIYK